ncbi:MAG: sulfatase [Verrucomicrobia bacterium]|nr:MAG: sulfatase [Verrucomicrobiota bacterium]
MKPQAPVLPRRIGVWSLALLSMLALGISSFNFSAQASPKNILLIIADDYGADSSSLYNSTNNGASLPPTPNIVSLVSSGVVFSRAVSYPVCSPTRSCLLTGQYGFRTGIGDVIDNGPSLTASVWTLPRSFTNAAPAYAFAQFGKWHLNLNANSPRNVGGWTNFAGSLAGAIANYTNWSKTINGTTTAGNTNYATTDLVNDATNWISARGTNAWFAWIAFNAPHTPLHFPPQNLCPSYPLSTLTNSVRQFNAMIEAMDTEIGRLLSVVDRANTHIIFLGDNGSINSVIQPPYPASRSKNTLYEGGTHVPLIISSPLVASPNRTNATPANMVDIFPTILELAGTSVAAAVPATNKIDGQSLVPALTGTNALARYGYTEQFGTSGPTAANAGRAIFDSRYKLIAFSTGVNEFYDLQNDPYESTNLLAGTLTTEQSNYYNSLKFRLYGYSTNTGAFIASSAWTNNQFSCTLTQAASYTLWRCDDVTTAFWSQVTTAVATTNGSSVTLKDVSPPAGRAFYSVVK